VTESNKHEHEKTDWKALALSLKDWLLTKAGKITAGVTIGLFIVTLMIVKACEPAKAGILYPICSSFAEQNVPFPETIKYNVVEQYSQSIRLYYSHIDAFGQFLTEYLECSFANDPEKGLLLKAVVYNTVKEVTEKKPLKNKGRLYQVQQEYVDLFNRSKTPQLIMQMDREDLDLTLPIRADNFAM